MSILFRSIDEPAPRTAGRGEHQPVQFLPAVTAVLPGVLQPGMSEDPRQTALEEAISLAESVSTPPVVQPSQRPSAPSQQPEISEQRPAPVQAQPEPSTGPEPEASQSEARKEEDPWGETWDRLKAIKAFHERRKATEAQAKEQEQEESDREDAAANEQVRTKEQTDKPRKRRVQFEYVEPGQPVTAMKLDDAPDKELPSPEPVTEIAAGSDEEIPYDDDKDPSDTIETAIRQAEAPPIPEEITDVGASEQRMSEAAPPVQLERPSEPIQKKTEPEVTQESLLPETEDIVPLEEDTEKTEELPPHADAESTDEVIAEQDLDSEIEIAKPPRSIETAIQKAETPTSPVKQTSKPETTPAEPSVEPTELHALKKSAIDSVEPSLEKEVQAKSDLHDQPQATVDQQPSAIEQPQATVDQQASAIEQPPATGQLQTAIDQPPAPGQTQTAIDKPPSTDDQLPASGQPQAAFDQPPPTASAPVEPVEKATKRTPSQQDKGLSQRIMDGARRLFRREEPSLKTVQPLPEIVQETALAEPPPSPVRPDTEQKETIQRAIATAEQLAPRELASREPVRPPEAPTAIQKRPVVKATLAQPSTPAETRPSLPERRPQVEAATTPEAPRTDDRGPQSLELQPDKLDPIGLQPLSEPEHFASPSDALRAKPGVVDQKIQKAELASVQPAAAPQVSKPLPESGSRKPDIAKIQEPAIKKPDALPLDGPAEAEEQEPEEYKIAEQAVPLEEAWPVQKIAPEEPEPQVETPPSRIQLSPDEPVVQRKTAGGDPSADKVDQALREVAPEVQSDSAIELVTPRRPRPVLKPVQRQATKTAVSEAESMPEKGPQSIQRQPASEEQIGEDNEEQPTDLPEPPPPPEMVPTEVGELPSDFWRYLGEEAPRPKHPSQSIDSGATQGLVQRDATDSGTAVATAERPSLDEAISQEWGTAVVQRTESRERTRVSQQATVEAVSEEAGEGSDVDIEKMAREVYAVLKRRLTIERERGRGRF